MHDRLGSITWIEPRSNDSEWLFKKIEKLGSLGRWVVRFFREGFSFKWFHPIKTCPNQRWTSGIRQQANEQRMSTAETIAIRALNSCRMRHRPTYVALRALLEKQQPSELPQLIRAAERKLQTRDSWRYFNYPIVKEVKPSLDVEYRECITGSPFTLIAEAILLREAVAGSSIQKAQKRLQLFVA